MNKTGRVTAVTITKMTREEYMDGGRGLTINYNYGVTSYGEVIVASTPKGVCLLEFANDRPEALKSLMAAYPNATFRHAEDRFQCDALNCFHAPKTVETAIATDNRQMSVNLHLKATDFQIKVWQALLEIPLGCLASYGDIARAIDRPGACRAVGTAIGKNPVAYIIPCHRVVRSSGDPGNYRWGAQRKREIIAHEAALLTRSSITI